MNEPGFLLADVDEAADPATAFVINDRPERGTGLFGGRDRQALGRFQSVKARHSDIHQHQMRSMLGGQAQNFAAVTGLGHYAHIRESFQQRANTSAYELVIIGD